MQWFYPGLITHGSSSSILEHSNNMMTFNNIPYIDISDCTVSIDSKNFEIQNTIFEIITTIYNLIINLHINIFDIITLISFISFWAISLILFTQSWEILINYSNFFNNKNNFSYNNKNFLNITTKLFFNFSNNFTQYYL